MFCARIGRFCPKKFPAILLQNYCRKPVMHGIKNCELQVQSKLIREDSFKNAFLEGQQIKVGVKFEVLD